jgi:hypothetical protein
MADLADQNRRNFLEDKITEEKVEEDKNKEMKEKFKREYLTALKKEGLFLIS